MRELEAVVEQCVLLTAGNTIRKEDLPETICFGRQKEAPFGYRPLKHLIERYETELIERAIKHYGSADAAAKALGVHRHDAGSQALEGPTAQCRIAPDMSKLARHRDHL